MALFTKSKTPEAPTLPTDDALEKRVHQLGRELLDESRSHRSSMLSAAFWSDKLMDWAMKDPGFKVQLFRFVDTFPMLRTPEQVHDHLVDYLSQPGVTPPPGLSMGLKAGGLLKGTMSRTVAKQITGMAEKFIAGEDAASALPKLEKLWNRGIGFSVDLLGEACVSDAEAIAFQEKYLDLVMNLPGTANGWAANETLDRDHIGPMPRANVSIKISSLYARTDPVDIDGSIAGLLDGIVPILEAAAENNVFINFDMEQYRLKDLTLELFMRCCEAVDFPGGLAMQAYLRSGDDDATRIAEWAKRTGRQVTVRLVKGAYWDQETIQAEEMGWPIPVWSRKAETDACFERMTARLVEAIPRDAGEGGIKLALGSHNIRSIALGMALLERHNLPLEALELQMLHGMAEEMKGAIVGRGLRLREYVPVGEMIPGMAYLVRRLLENTSNESWLRAGFADEAAPEVLLASPHRDLAGADPGVKRVDRAAERHQLSGSDPDVGDGRPFMNEAFRDFSQAEVRDAFRVAVEASVVPDVATDATEEDADRAITAAHAALPRWRDTEVAERAKVLVGAAAIMRRRRDELCGIIIREAGKTWREADGDVCEAIDFCEYYAREAVRLFRFRRLGQFVGELDQIIYEPKGVAAVISPWNFPLAILCGMTTAALVCGNPAIMKPALPTRGIAKVLHEILLEAGAPPDVIQLLVGSGRVVGARMVRDPRTALIAFTGSKEVGCDILQVAGQVPAGQGHVKKVICEMGGKNAVIVDESADLDEAVIGVRDAAFGYQGQKCSACSRAIVVGTTYEPFLERLCASTAVLKIGNPVDASVDFGPIIDESAARTIEEYIEVGKKEARLALSMEMPAASELMPDRHYVTPHIFAEVPTDARIANEEIFGPVLSVMRVDTFEEALRLANGTEYALTGGLYSRKPTHIERARREFRVGNLYINRPCTGALVGRQPFGGGALSGVGTKAGGDDYLFHFCEMRAVCENTMRRGFAPGLDDTLDD